MKIKYNLEFNYFKLFNKAQGISMFRKNILKDPYKYVNSYLGECWRFFKWIILDLLIACLFKIFHFPSIFTRALLYLFAASMGLMTILLILFFFMYLDTQKRSKRGEFTIKKDGISDANEDGVKIGIPWKFVDYIVVQDEIICILTKLSFLYFFDETISEQILEAVMKYAPDIKIINQSTKRIEIVEDMPEEVKETLEKLEEKEENYEEKKEK